MIEKPTVIKEAVIVMDKGEVDYFFTKELQRRYPDATETDYDDSAAYEVSLISYEDGQLRVVLGVTW